MTAKTGKTTLDDVAKSIDGIQSQLHSVQTQIDDTQEQISSMQMQIGGMQTQISGMQTQIGDIQEQMVTKGEFGTSISRLETTIRREAGDLGGSIASLTNMVAKEFDSLTVARSKLKPARLGHN